MKPRRFFRRPASLVLCGVLAMANASGSPAQSAAPAMTVPTSTPRLVATYTHRITVPLPIAEAFTFFEPIGEKRWAEGWSPAFASPADAELSDNTVFTRTVNPPGGPSQTSIWLITRYDRAESVIEYRTVVPELRVSRITVSCQTSGEGETAVTVTYRHTSLSAAGTRFIQELTEEKYRASIEHWAEAIRAYLVRGTPATP